MKSYTLLCFFLSLAMILSPLCSLSKTADVINREFLNEEPQKTKSAFVKIMSADSKNITETSLREYLIGAAAAEMNPAYHEEALKAQIIASHTLLEYTKRKKPIENADISDDSKTHQGYLDENARRKKWGDNYDRYSEKLSKCVDEVTGLLIFYDDEVIASTFYALSSGKTENAKDVWGGDYPYLVSVGSPGDKLSPAYQSSVAVSESEFKSALEKQGAALTETPDKWIGEIKKTDAGSVKSIVIGNKDFKGTEIRKIFNLKSSAFTCAYKDGNFVFTVSGYGHGVGMSQYGADFMARQGADYKEILRHYYPNTEIK